eukprot:218742-Rhodomonas_salina.2
MYHLQIQRSVVGVAGKLCDSATCAPCTVPTAYTWPGLSSTLGSSALKLLPQHIGTFLLRSRCHIRGANRAFISRLIKSGTDMAYAASRKDRRNGQQVSYSHVPRAFYSPTLTDVSNGGIRACSGGCGDSRELGSVWER